MAVDLEETGDGAVRVSRYRLPFVELYSLSFIELCVVMKSLLSLSASRCKLVAASPGNMACGFAMQNAGIVDC